VHVFLRMTIVLAVLVFGVNAEALMVFSTDFESGLPGEFAGAGTIQVSQGYSTIGFGNRFRQALFSSRAVYRASSASALQLPMGISTDCPERGALLPLHYCTLVIITTPRR
jgi:hypothetical protein